jgi:amidase
MRRRAPMPGIQRWPVHQTVAALQRGEVLPESVVDACIEQIDRYNGLVNAIVTLEPYDHGRQSGASRPVLAGVPFTVKDTIETAGLRTTAGDDAFGGYVPDQDAVVVARIRFAGGIVLGKSNTPRLAGDLITDNRLFGRTSNPWDLTRTPGGSSGGGAAAVSAGFSPIDIGSDHAGSLRLPASYCGVYAHGPTYGIVPTRGHLPPGPGTAAPRDFMTIGPIARSAKDLALVLEIISGADSGDADAWQLRLPRPRAQSPAGLRVAVWSQDDFLFTDPAITAGCRQAADALEDLGATVDRDARPEVTLRESATLFSELLGATVGPVLDDERFKLAQAVAGLGGDESSVQIRDARSCAIDHRSWSLAQNKRVRQVEMWCRFFEVYDVVLTPVSPVVAPVHTEERNRYARRIQQGGHEWSYFDQLTWVGLASLGGLPATVAPIGLNEDGLPIGVQIIGGRYRDLTTIWVADLLESVIEPLGAPPLDRYLPDRPRPANVDRNLEF